MLKILSIGNSFSQDATRYVWGIARDAGKQVKVVNLYIGGCTLERHYRNMLSKLPAYDFEINGMMGTGVKISLRDALLSDCWDVITIQQQSLEGSRYESFVPYLGELVAYVRKHAPKAELWMHSTWGYKPESEKLEKSGFETHDKMELAIRKNYARWARDIGACGIIPAGEAVRLANELGAPHIYRDEFHMSRGFGRLLLGLVWASTLLGVDPEENGFADLDEPVTEEEIALARRVAARIRKS